MKEGRAIHKEIENFLNTGEAGRYTEAFSNFIAKHEKDFGEVIAYETPLFSSLGKYCGTPDLILENAIVDIKRSFHNAKYHALQLAAYHELAMIGYLSRYNVSHRNFIILVLNTDGSFKATNVWNRYALNIFKTLITKHNIEKNLDKYLNNKY
jgi:hypothetical protein